MATDTGIALAGRLTQAVSDEFIIDGKSVRSGLTIGIALYPRDGKDAAALLANSGAALFRAKAHSRDGRAAVATDDCWRLGRWPSVENPRSRRGSGEAQNRMGPHHCWCGPMD